MSAETDKLLRELLDHSQAQTLLLRGVLQLLRPIARKNEMWSAEGSHDKYAEDVLYALNESCARAGELIESIKP